MLINGIDTKDISVVVQGAIDKEYTPLCLKSIRKYLPESEIILSTWEGSEVENLDYDILVLNKDPGGFLMSPSEINNVKRQIISTINGINKSNRNYILKIRTDMCLCGNKFLHFFSKYNKFNYDYKFVEQRILVSSLPTRNPIDWETPYCISDWITFGFKKDTVLLWDIKFPSYEEENWFNIHPKDIKILYSYDVLIARFNPEQHIIISFIKKFMKDVYCNNMFDNNNKAIELNINILVNNFLVLSPKLYNFKFLKPLRNGDWYHILTHNKWLKYYNKTFNEKRKLISIDFEKLSYIKHIYNAKKRYYNNGLKIENNKLKALRYILNNKIPENKSKDNYNIFIICKYEINLECLNQTLESILVQTHKKIKFILIIQLYLNETEKKSIDNIMRKYGIHYILIDKINTKFSDLLSVLNIENEKYFRFINIGDVLHPQTLEFEINMFKKYKKIDLIYHDYIAFKNILPNFHLNKDNIELTNTKNILCDLDNDNIVGTQISFIIRKDFIEILNYIDKNKLIKFDEIFYYFIEKIEMKKYNILKIYPKYIGIKR